MALRHRGVARAVLGLKPEESPEAAAKPPAERCKAALQRACGRITLAHTMPAAEISPFSVTSFYRVGTATGLYEEADVVADETVR